MIINCCCCGERENYPVWGRAKIRCSALGKPNLIMNGDMFYCPECVALLRRIYLIDQFEHQLDSLAVQKGDAGKVLSV